MSRNMQPNQRGSSHRVFRYIYQQLRPFRGFIGGALMLILAEVLLVTLVLPSVLENIVNTAGITPGKNWFHALKKGIICFLGLQIMVEVLVRLEDYLLAVRVLPRLRRRLYRHNVAKILRKKYVFYERSSMGKVSENLVRISDTLPEIVETFVLKLMFFLLSFICVIYVFYTVHLFLALMLLLFFAVLVLAMVLFNKRISITSNAWSYKVAMVSGRIIDLLSNIQLVRLFVGRKRERKKLDVVLRKMQRDEASLQCTYLTMFALVGVAHIVLQGACFYFLLQRGLQGIISVGQLTAVIYINETLMGLLWYDLPDLAILSMQFGEVGQALEGLEAGKNECDHPRAQPLSVTQGNIVFDNVQFRFQKHRPLFFKNLNVTIPAKQKVGIVGYAGSGKSTFIKLLLRLYHIDAGKITIDGQDLAKVTHDSLRHNIGVMLQDMAFFQRSLLENIQYGNPSASPKMITKALHDAQSYDFVMDPTAKKIDFTEDVNRTISGGQKQKLSISRVIVKDAPILIFDEPTASLDALTEHSIQKTLDGLMKDKTSIVIAHRLSTILKLDRILVFDKGEIVEDGTHHELLAQKGLYAELWKTQAGGMRPKRR